jgi:hypothetical protein
MSSVIFNSKCLLSNTDKISKTNNDETPEFRTSSRHPFGVALSAAETLGHVSITRVSVV